MSQTFFVRRNNTVKGPISIHKLRQAIDDRKVKLTDEISIESDGPFVELKTVYRPVLNNHWLGKSETPGYKDGASGCLERDDDVVELAEILQFFDDDNGSEYAFYCDVCGHKNSVSYPWHEKEIKCPSCSQRYFAPVSAIVNPCQKPTTRSRRGYFIKLSGTVNTILRWAVNHPPYRMWQFYVALYAVWCLYMPGHVSTVTGLFLIAFVIGSNFAHSILSFAGIFFLCTLYSTLLGYSMSTFREPYKPNDSYVVTRLGFAPPSAENVFDSRLTVFIPMTMNLGIPVTILIFMLGGKMDDLSRKLSGKLIVGFSLDVNDDGDTDMIVGTTVHSPSKEDGPSTLLELGFAYAFTSLIVGLFVYLALFQGDAEHWRVVEQIRLWLFDTLIRA